MIRARAALFGLLLAFPACRSEASRRLESEALALRRPIDSLRNAPNEAKPELLRALSAAPCASPEACSLKRTCVDGYTRHLAALDASERARRLLADPHGGTRASIEAATELSKADLDLAESRALTERCASLQGELLRKARER